MRPRSSRAAASAARSLHNADPSQRLNRNMPRRRTSRSPSMGIYRMPITPACGNNRDDNRNEHG
eukprot:3678791-Pyramimonas_sp.AAC.2